MSAICPGDKVIITDAFGRQHEAIADSHLEVKGHSFPVIWVRAPYRDGRPGTWRAPWPVESVAAASSTPTGDTDA